VVFLRSEAENASYLTKEKKSNCPSCKSNYWIVAHTQNLRFLVSSCKVVGCSCHVFIPSARSRNSSSPIANFFLLKHCMMLASWLRSSELEAGKFILNAAAVPVKAQRGRHFEFCGQGDNLNINIFSCGCGSVSYYSLQGAFFY